MTLPHDATSLADDFLRPPVWPPPARMVIPPDVRMRFDAYGVTGIVLMLETYCLEQMEHAIAEGDTPEARLGAFRGGSIQGLLPMLAAKDLQEAIAPAEAWAQRVVEEMQADKAPARKRRRHA